MQRALKKLAMFVPMVVLCFLTNSTDALDPARTINQFHHTQWTSKEGAPSQIVALAQTTDGFLWIGTSGGLFRFDGVRFERFAPQGTDLPSANVYALEATGDGGLWVSFRPSGLGYIHDGTIDVFNSKEQLPRSQVYCFEIDGVDRLWAGTHNGLALRRDDGGWTEIGEEWGITPQRVWSMFTDSKGSMWVALEDSIVVLHNGTDRFERVADKSNVVVRFGEAPDGKIWKAEDGDFVRALPSATQSFGIRISNYAGSVLFDRDGALWFTDDDGIKRIRSPITLASDILSRDDPRVELLETGDSLSGPILEDREGNIWIGSPQGLNRFRYSYFIANRASARYRNMTLLPDRRSGVWIGSSLKLPLAHVDGENIRTFPDVIRIASVARGPGDVVWWGGDSRILRQAGDVITPYDFPVGLKDDWLWEVFLANDGEYVWVRPGDTPLMAFENGQWRAKPQPSGLPDRGPSASFTEGSNRTWLGYTENRVAMIEGTVGKLFTAADGIDVGRIRVIRKGRDRIWIGGELGLAIFDGTRFRTIRTTEAHRFGTVSGIVFSSDGAIWLNEVQGIVRISGDEVGKLVSNPEHNAEFRRFDFEDGLPGAPQMNWTVSTTVEAVDGRLWFATDGGLVSVDPSNLASNPLPPPVSIRTLAAGEETYNVHKPINLPEGTEDLSIAYTALSLSIPERVAFRYMLEGVDSDWQEAHSRREAFYTNLGPGDYKFRVIASNNDGVWNTEGAALAFHIAPRFYQTNWFLGLCALGFGTLLILSFRLRLKKLQTRMHLQFEQRLAERGRIAQDLHDTLLQGFVSASMQLDVAIDSLSNDSPKKARLERVHEMIKRLITEGRETVQGLRSTRRTDSESFEEQLFTMREELDAGHNIEFSVTVHGHPRPLHPIIHDEVRPIAHEAVFNAFRHAKASKIEVGLAYSDRKFFLSVRDDGRGIEPEIVLSGRDGHWGLTGMRERAQEIGARLKVFSSKGRGTEIELTVPGRVAYEDPGVSWRTRLLEGFTGLLTRRQTRNK